jgi:hypothetical protein
MANVKISELPVSSGNTFNTIFPQVKGGTTNQIALSGFNTNDFTNVVNLGTGTTQTILLDGALGDVFVCTGSGSTDVIFTALTQNMVQGKLYQLVIQGATTLGTTTVVDNTNSYAMGVVLNNRSVIQPFYIINGALYPWTTSLNNLLLRLY